MTVYFSNLFRATFNIVECLQGQLVHVISCDLANILHQPVIYPL